MAFIAYLILVLILVVLLSRKPIYNLRYLNSFTKGMKLSLSSIINFLVLGVVEYIGNKSIFVLRDIILVVGLVFILVTYKVLLD